MYGLSFNRSRNSFAYISRSPTSSSNTRSHNNSSLDTFYPYNNSSSPVLSRRLGRRGKKVLTFSRLSFFTNSPPF